MKTLIHWITRKTFFCSYCCGVCGLRFSLVMSVLSEDYLSIMPVPEFIWDVYHCSRCSHGSMQGHGKEPQFPWPWTLLASIRAAGAAPSAVQLQCPAQLLHCCSSIGTDACFSLRVGYHSGTVNFCWFLLEWQGGMYHLSQTLYQSCGPPSSLEFMRSCRGRKCVMDVFVHCAALAASLFFVTLGSPSPCYLVLLRHTASPLFKKLGLPQTAQRKQRLETMAFGAWLQVHVQFTLSQCPPEGAPWLHCDVPVICWLLSSPWVRNRIPWCLAWVEGVWKIDGTSRIKAVVKISGSQQAFVSVFFSQIKNFPR